MSPPLDGAVGLIGNNGRNTADFCDTKASHTNADMSAHFMSGVKMGFTGVRTPVKPIFTPLIKCADMSALVWLAFVSQKSAVLRPLFPIKPTAPSNGGLIIIGDELVLRSAKKCPLYHWTQRP